MRAPTGNFPVFKLEELEFAAEAHCRCGAGLAYIPSRAQEAPYKYWNCSYLLMNDVKVWVVLETNILKPNVLEDENGRVHDGGLSFSFFEIKSEKQPSANGATTRPGVT